MIKLKLLFAASILSTVALAQTEVEKDNEEKTRGFQATFITPMGTNGIQAPEITNKFSINILAGVAKGLDGAEIGGLVNVLLEDMKGMQAAGFANAVLGDVKGIQLSGFANYAGGNSHGLAAAGFSNINIKNTTGSQIAGFANVNLQDMKGFQGSGFANVNIGSFEGVQIAGFANIVAADIKGTQLSGFVNYANKVDGFQLGIINIADSVDGASIGLLSFVRKGVHQIEISADEVFYTGLALRTGTRRFHNILSIGMTPESTDLLWNVGYGIGTSFKLNDKWNSDITLSTHHVSIGEFYTATSELYKLYAGVEFKVRGKFTVAAGPTFNLYLTDTLLPDYKSGYDDIAPYSIFDSTNSNDFNMKGWFGAKVAVRFL